MTRTTVRPIVATAVMILSAVSIAGAQTTAGAPVAPRGAVAATR